MVSNVRSVITLFHASSAACIQVHFQHMVYHVEKLDLLNNSAPFLSFVTLSTFVTLSVNSAKGQARWAERCFAVLSMTGVLHNCR